MGHKHLQQCTQLKVSARLEQHEKYVFCAYVSYLYTFMDTDLVCNLLHFQMIHGWHGMLRCNVAAECCLNGYG